MVTLPIKIMMDSHRKILNTIRIHKEISGAELARITKYQPSTVLYILRSLEADGFIEISRIGSSLGSAGKPPTLWKLVGDRGYIIGIEVIPHEIRTTVVDFACNIVHQEIKKDIADFYGEQISSGIVKFVREIIEKLNLPKDKIIGVGVALPGLVDRKQGIVHYSRNLFLKNFPLQNVLHDLLNLPVAVANDSNAGALGIRWHSNNTENLPPNVVFLTINEKIRDIGAGLILNNQLYEGASGTAGELSSSLPIISKLIEKGKNKYGTNSPVLEEYLLHGSFSISEVAKHAKKNCHFSNFILRSISKFITEEILRIIEFINPNSIVIGGDISEAEFIINDFIVPAVKKKALKIFPTAGILIPEISFSSFGIYSVSIGATALILREIFGY